MTSRLKLTPVVVHFLPKHENLLVFVYHKYDTGLAVKIGEINHQPALLFYHGNELKICQVFAIEPESNKIVQISNVLDPEKLKSIGNGDNNS